MLTYQLQEAKAKLSALVKHIAKEPITISVHGTPQVVMLSKAEYDRLTVKKQTLAELLRSSPLRESDFDNVRDASPPREVEL